ncbi:MAG: hypothetical protein LBQ66_07685 [Planctomycetaceae bacterium]|jgi:hypothetical protein|nr:hypothetical protein [Planctomycetaceae bacterium]
MAKKAVKSSLTTVGLPVVWDVRRRGDALYVQAFYGRIIERCCQLNTIKEIRAEQLEDGSPTWIITIVRADSEDVSYSCSELKKDSFFAAFAGEVSPEGNRPKPTLFGRR